MQFCGYIVGYLYITKTQWSYYLEAQGTPSSMRVQNSYLSNYLDGLSVVHK